MMSSPVDERRHFLQAFGSRVREARRQRGWSQDELAERAGLHRTFVGAIERGSCGLNLSRLPGLAHALDLEPSDLLADAASRSDVH